MQEVAAPHVNSHIHKIPGVVGEGIPGGRRQEACGVREECGCGCDGGIAEPELLPDVRAHVVKVPATTSTGSMTITTESIVQTVLLLPTEAWGVDRHTVRHAGPVSIVLQF